MSGWIKNLLWRMGHTMFRIQKFKIKSTHIVLQVLLVGSLNSIATPAEAATQKFSIGKYFSGSLNNIIKFGSNDCIDVPIKYKSPPYMLNYPDHLITASIRKVGDNDEETGGFASLELGKRDDYQGIFNLRLCKEADIEFDEDGNSIVSSPQGTYYFQANLTQLRPFVLKESKKIKITIKY